MESGVYTIGDYILDFSECITPKGLRAICAKRGIEASECYSELTEMDVDLVVAESYNWMLNNVATLSKSVSDTDGDWSHSEGGAQIDSSTKRRWRNECERLCRKWGIPIEGKQGIKIINL